MHQFERISAKDVRLTSPYWRSRQELFCREVIEQQWRILNGEVEIDGVGRSHCVDNFRIAAGEQEGEFDSYWFSDHELYKWMEGAIYSLAIEENAQTEEHLHYITGLLKKAQWADGYLGTYYTLHEPGKRWTNFALGHEMLNMGNLIEAAVAWFVLKGERSLLEVAIRCADNIDNMVHTIGKDVFDGHEEIEIALIKLYAVTREERYLRLCERLLDNRGKGYCDFPRDNPPMPLSYYQAHKPVREQDTAEGHAVRAMYLYTAMTELAAITDDRQLLDTVNTLWQNMVTRRIYITGGIGSEDFAERFTPDYDLPNDRAYSETCAGIGLMMFARAKLQLQPDAQVADVMETALYNTVMAGISMDGSKYFYVNPLYVRPEVTAFRHDMNLSQPNRQEWMFCPCCPPNLVRLVASLGDYLYTADDERLYLNLLLSNELDTRRKGRALRLSVQGNEPAQGAYRITAGTDVGTLYVKKPGWAATYSVKRGGQDVICALENGYLKFADVREGEVLELQLDLRPRFVYSHPQIEDDCGKTAVQRGFVVYCAESADNGPCLSGLIVDDERPLTEQWQEAFGLSIPFVQAQGRRVGGAEALYSYTRPQSTPCGITLVPYAFWNNRGPGEMSVWLKRARL